jgi:3-deoxy-D-manno-octulosonic-acid transferase
MIRRLYTLLFYLAVPLVLLRLWYKGKKNPAYRERIKERFGYPSFTCKQAIWLHAVSLGESVAAIPLVEELLKTYPEQPLVITNTTPTGSEKIQKHFGARVQHCYFPYDLPTVWQRFFKRIDPKFILIMETELWPNLLEYAHQKKVPVLLVNARISDISIREYSYLKPLIRAMLSRINIIAAQSELDAERFKALGADPNKVFNIGNLKFDVKVAEDLVTRAEAVKTQLSQQPIWIAASTHPGEEMQILKIHEELLKEYPEALLILVPRHPERFNEVARLIESHNFKYVRKSSGALPDADTQVFLGDTMGELQFYYALADIAFIGGTLVPIGGHNPLEALVLGKKVLSGPHTQNAKLMYEELVRAGLVVQVQDKAALKRALVLAFTEPLDQNYINAYMQKFQGVKAKILALLKAPEFH